jgi:hypothetical protein
MGTLLREKIVHAEEKYNKKNWKVNFTLSLTPPDARHIFCVSTLMEETDDSTRDSRGALQKRNHAGSICEDGLGISNRNFAVYPPKIQKPKVIGKAR